jgi:transcriptional regulator with XRE-family HTH domain
MKALTPALFIRSTVFGFGTQREFADALGYEQPTVSRWERGEGFSSEAQKRIRVLAKERGVKWDNNWFFEVPSEYLSAA